MKIAVLIECHRDPEQVKRMISAMRHSEMTFFVHADRKANFDTGLLQGEDIFILPEEDRVDVRWATISQVDAALNLLRYARQQGEYDFYWLCSGQDFPLKSPETIVHWFEQHRENDFVALTESKNTGLGRENNYDKRNAIYFPSRMLGGEKWRRAVKRLYTELTGGFDRTFSFARRKAPEGTDFYFGSQWVCLTGRTAAWMMAYLKEHPEYYAYYRNCNCPDESFFQTLLMLSPYAGLRMDGLHYVDWTEGKSSPKVLTAADMEKLRATDKLMARKIDLTKDSTLPALLEAELRSGKP